MTALDPSGEERLANLRAAAASRPAHARYLEALVKWAESGIDWNTLPDYTEFRISAKVSKVLEDEVSTIFAHESPMTIETRYVELRAAHARAHAAREQTKNSLERILP